VLKLNAAGNAVVYATYLGGNSDDQARGIAVDAAGCAYVTGFTASPNFPVRSPIQAALGGGASDTFVSKLSCEAAPALPQLTAGGIVNAAGYQGTSIAPGEIVSIYGTNFGPVDLTLYQLDGTGKIATALAGTRVYFDGAPAPLLWVMANRASAIIPYSVSGKSTAKVQIEFQGVKSDATDVAVSAALPALFTATMSGKGQGSILNQDYGLNSKDNPAVPGSIVMLYGTGEGQTQPGGVDGSFANSVYPKPFGDVKVQIGGRDAEVFYAGAAPMAVAGLFQVNVRIPEGTPAGDAQIVMVIGGVPAPQGVTVAVR
jgi:uncharacterized protein (TIGR03437 family)